MESTIDKTSTSTTAASVTFIYNTQREEVVQNCEELVFSAFAVNNIVSSCDWRIPNKYSVPHYKTGFLIFGHLVLVDYLQNHACYKHTQYIKMISVLY